MPRLAPGMRPLETLLGTRPTNMVSISTDSLSTDRTFPSPLFETALTWFAFSRT
ncbi:unnamed protein product [Arabidopsis halleri]